VRFSFHVICTQNNVTTPRIFWFRIPKLPSSFMLNNQNIKQKPIPSYIYLSYVLSQLTPVTTTIAAAAPSSSSFSAFASASLLLFVLYGTTQEVQVQLLFLFFFGFSANNLIFNLE
jgi:hypothetical protein